MQMRGGPCRYIYATHPRRVISLLRIPAQVRSYGLADAGLPPCSAHLCGAVLLGKGGGGKRMPAWACNAHTFFILHFFKFRGRDKTSRRQGGYSPHRNLFDAMVPLRLWRVEVFLVFRYVLTLLVPFDATWAPGVYVHSFPFYFPL